MIRRLLWFLAILSLAPALPTVVAGAQTRTQDQSAPVNFTILPGNQQPGKAVVRACSYTVERGGVLRDTLLIVNPSRTTSLTVRLSVSDAVTQPQGGGVSFGVSAQPRAIGRWLHLGATLMHVPPYHISSVPILLAVPAEAQAGLYEGVVNATDLQPQTISAGKMHVRVLMNRQCIVQLRVPGRAPIGLAVEHPNIVHGSAYGVLVFTVRNAGTVPAYPTMITARFVGARTYGMRATAGMILGGDSTLLAYPLEQQLPAGRYHVEIVVQYWAAPSDTVLSRQTLWNGQLTEQ